MKTKMRIIGLVGAALLLSACGPEVSGSDKPPASFGSIEKQILGCPSVQGVYSWPPVDGTYAKGFASNRDPWEGGVPMYVRKSPMQIWIRENNGEIELRSRSINRNPRVRDRLAHEWGYVTYSSSEFNCSSDRLEFKEKEMATTEDFGGKGIRRSFVLARLKDGSIAVGIKTIAYGRKGSYFSWGGQSYGTYNARDKVFWSWSKLEFMEAGASEPAPVDVAR